MRRPSSTPPAFAPEERRRVERAVRQGQDPPCPVCGVEMDRRSVPPRSDVSYVRDRVWLTCATCGRSVVVDR